MPNPDADPSRMAEAIAELAATMERLQARQDAAQRADRRLRLGLFLATLAAVGSAAYLALAPVAGIMDRIAPPRLAIRDPVAAETQRQALLASLTPAERARLDEFERQAKLVRHYAEVSPDFDAAATIALFLSQLSRSVSVMPELHGTVAALYDEMRGMSDQMRLVNEQMRVMNTRMDALPVLATEVQAMHGQMAFTAAGMDSTMGRAGRMMPWNW
jgi:hypothetical protein